MSETTQATAKLDVRAYPIAEPKGSTVAFASVTVNDMIAINGIRVVSSEKGLFAAMPQTKDTNGEYRDIAFPVTKELRQQLNKAILDEYAAAKEQPASVKDQIREGTKAAKDAPANDAPAAAKTAKKTGPEH
jgi:stage V sporulation protein G